jgi:LAGLIDADG endonuclease
MLHKKDLALLERVQAFYGVGTIIKGIDSVCFSVQSIKYLINVIIPHFDRYPLVGEKQADFLLSIVELMYKKKHLTIEGLREIVSISASLNLGLSDELVKAFPDITPIKRAKLEAPEIIDPHWLTGFVDGEGCFFVGCSSSKAYTVGYQVPIIIYNNTTLS